ncbi:hypothetical protein EW146_g4471 [Bondarzewia mesenterica]|uniref:Uncharacterized protein n=1 Tax=Bondarzewia mesenterica TaxID=1095465 RepID=A0A4S4LVJ8_9AGAM|nr:hypothetical protein EW146_g4471 [Bondarzewia mesenterica]
MEADSELFASLVCEAILYDDLANKGIYFVLFAGSMHILLFRRRSITVRLVHNFVLGMTVVMFSVSTIHMGLSIKIFYNSFLKGTYWDPSSPGTDPLCITKLYLPAINFILSDALVIWRAYVLWSFNINVCIVPVILVLATGAVAIVGAQQSAAHMSTVLLYRSYHWDLTMNCLTLATNVITTGLVAYRGRWYRRTSGDGTPSVARKRSRAVLALLIESGFLYCLTWVVFFIVYWIGPHGIFITTDMISQLTGIYSTLIIGLVALKMSQKDPVGVDQSFIDTFWNAPFEGSTETMTSGPTTISSARALNGRGQPIVVHITNSVEVEESRLDTSKEVQLAPIRFHETLSHELG